MSRYFRIVIHVSIARFLREPRNMFSGTLVRKHSILPSHSVVTAFTLSSQWLLHSPFKFNGHCVYSITPMVTVCFNVGVAYRFCAFCTQIFRLVFRVNSSFFPPKQHQLAISCNTQGMCLYIRYKYLNSVSINILLQNVNGLLSWMK